MNKFTIISGDNTRLSGYSWEGKTPLKGTIYLIHGLGEHSGRYSALASYFVNSGFTVISIDLRGHGQSSGKRGHTSNYQDLLTDIKLLLELGHKENPNFPAFLYGHSLGGNLALNFALRYKENLSGVIVTSPWLELSNPPSTLLLQFVKIINKVKPEITFPNNIDIGHLYHGKPELEYGKDPLVHNRISARLFNEVHKAGEWAISHASEFSYPLLLMHGASDNITSFSASKRFAEIAGKNCTFKAWPDNYHELHNDLNREEVIFYIESWITDLLQLL